MPDVTSELLQRYDRPGPRYTSYPTAVEFSEDFDPREYSDRLEGLSAEEPVSLYVHLPFCRHRCTFCGCHVIATPRRDAAARYLEYLEREIEVLDRHLAGRARLEQYHWGGGTPTYYEPDEMVQLQEAVRARFDILPDAEVAVEVDPRVTTPDQVDTLRDLGFNRISMGVQDFTPQVQEAIGRNQGEEDTVRLYEHCRARGFASINVDLIYGLPAQTSSTFRHALDRVIAMRPDRVAVYSYAHVPWVRGHQKRIDADLLPGREAKFELFAAAIRAFREGGYRLIGMDHFALPGDELATALEERRLHRSFMGYTVQRTPVMLGLGISSIGDVAGVYAQNAKKLKPYYDALDSGSLPVERGYALTPDDLVRRHVIQELMCNLYLDVGDVERRFGVVFQEYFGEELAQLCEAPVTDGLVQLSPETIEVTDLGQLFIRNICMPFDRHLRDKPRRQPTFSRTV